MKLARTKGLNVTGVYQEVRSGETIAARPEMQRLLNDVEDGRWAGVLVMEVERLARGNTTDQGIVADTFKYTNTKIITPAKVYDPSNEFDEEYFEFGLFMSRREYKTINRRLQRGRQASLNEGKYIAGKAVYGYERYKLPKEKGYSLRPIPQQAETVRLIFDWYVRDGMGAYVIAKRLDAMGIPSPTGGKWPTCTITGIIKNPTYIGMLRWSHRPVTKKMVNGVMTTTRPVHDDVPLSPGIHPPIIDRPTWDAAQQILRSRSHAPVPKSTQIQNPLAGLIYCSRCGRSMERRIYTHGRPMLMCPNKDCTCMSSTLDDVEASLLDSLRTWLIEYKLQISAQQQAAPDTPAPELERTIQRLQQNIATLKKQMDSLYDLLEQGVYTPDTFLTRSQALAEKMTAASNELTAAQQAQENQQRLYKSRHEIAPRIEHLLATYPTLDDPKEKNDMLKAVLKKAVYTKTQGGRWTPSDLNLHVFPKLEDD
jgi:DNA invertase Pin-like site-specific DNA recombinase